MDIEKKSISEQKANTSPWDEAVLEVFEEPGNTRVAETDESRKSSRTQVPGNKRPDITSEGIIRTMALREEMGRPWKALIRSVTWANLRFIRTTLVVLWKNRWWKEQSENQDSWWDSCSNPGRLWWCTKGAHSDSIYLTVSCACVCTFPLEGKYQMSID